MDPTEQLSSLLPALNAVVDRIEPMQLNNQTPCSDFTVHDVLDHMMVLAGTFAYSFRGVEGPDVKAPPVYGRVPAPEFRKAMDDLLDAMQAPGAAERIISAPVGDVPGSTFARFVAFDGLVHGWDLATATGQSYEPPATVVAAVDGFVRDALTPEMRDGDTFKDATTAPEGASRMERLAAFSGRSL